MGVKTGVQHRLRRLKTLPVAPTILTAGNLACGITAILCAAHADEKTPSMLVFGCYMIFLAMICDMFDGKVARMTKTAGPFGAELDSLADIVSFGVAPAILVHRMVMGHPGVFEHGERLLWFLTVFYAVMAAIRLARYNVEHTDAATAVFRGLPSPGAAALVVSWVLLAHDERARAMLTGWGLIHEQSYHGLGSIDVFGWATLAVLVASALLMVSRIPYPHVGNALGGRIRFRGMIALILCGGALLAGVPWELLLWIVTTGYVLVGFCMALPKLFHRRQPGEPADDDDDDDAEDLTDLPPNEKAADPGPLPGR